MQSLLGILFFAFGLAASIALHELGHFLPAKKFGVKVTQFMVGFGPTLWSRRRGETEYGLKAIPLGGYIRMIGMFPPASAVAPRKRVGRFSATIEGARTEAYEDFVEEDASRTFYALSVPKKLAIMFGGPFTNLLIATVLFGGLYIGHGTLQANTTLEYVYPCVPTSANPLGELNYANKCEGSAVTPAYAAGLQEGDQIVSIDGVPIERWNDIGQIISQSINKSVSFSVKRTTNSEQSEEIVVQPIAAPSVDGQSMDGRGFIGVWPQTPLVKMSVTQLPSEMISMTQDAASSIIQFPISVIKLSANLFSSETRDPNGPVSVIGVGQISGDIAGAENLTTQEKLLNLTSLLAGMNLFLFVFNMVPLLPLDGGHIAGALFEGMRRVKARITGRGFAGPTDTARLIPMTYVVSLTLLVLGGIVIVADIVKPLSIFG